MSNSDATSRRWSLLREIVVMQFKLKDQSTVLGFGWSFLNPLFMLATLFVFFSQQVGRTIEHYAMYLLVGLVHFTHFSNSTNSAMTVMANLRRLTCDAIFPKELLVAGTVIASSIEFVVSMAVCVVIAALSGVRLSSMVALLPLVIVLQILLVAWLSFLLAVLYVFAADVTHIYQVLLRILFFVTPTFYSASFVAGTPAHLIVALNPLAHVIDLSRSAILGAPRFSVWMLLILLAINGAALVAALALFRRYEPVFAERL